MDLFLIVCVCVRFVYMVLVTAEVLWASFVKIHVLVFMLVIALEFDVGYKNDDS